MCAKLAKRGAHKSLGLQRVWVDAADDSFTITGCQMAAEQEGIAKGDRQIIGKKLRAFVGAKGVPRQNRGLGKGIPPAAYR